MPPIARILVPLDFSPQSARALAYAEELARRFGAELLLLHVSELLAVVPGSDLIEAKVLTAQRDLTLLAERLRESGLTASGTVRAGAAHAEIVRVAAAERSDLIVMGTHGRGGLARALMGSVAERVVRRAGCPVLMVPHAAANEPHAQAC